MYHLKRLANSLFWSDMKKKKKNWSATPVIGDLFRGVLRYRLVLTLEYAGKQQEIEVYKFVVSF